MARTRTKSPKPKTDSKDDVLLRVPRRSAEAIQSMSAKTGFSIQSIVDWLAWLGSTSMGRKISIKDNSKALEMSLEEWEKLKPLDK